MKDNILTPLFALASQIFAETTIELRFDARRINQETDLISWYVGECEDPSAGSLFDYLNINDLDEDKLVRWVSELQALLDDYNTPLDEFGIPIEDRDDADAESSEDIARTENRIIDQQEI